MQPSIWHSLRPLFPPFFKRLVGEDEASGDPDPDPVPLPPPPPDAALPFARPPDEDLTILVVFFLLRAPARSPRSFGRTAVGRSWLIRVRDLRRREPTQPTDATALAAGWEI